MGLITPDLSGIADAAVADAIDFTNPLNTIINEINGNLDSTNLTTGAVATANIADDAITPAKLALSNDSNTVATEQTTTSTTYADLSTVGPTITYTPTVATTVLLMYGATISNSTAGSSAFAAPVISGATTLAASDANAAQVRAPAANSPVGSFSRSLITTLTAGANTIKLQYRAEANTATFANRWLIMIPIA